MPIIPLLESGFFDPAATKILIAAFDTTWQMLKTSGNVLAADYRAASTRELLAKRIIETARLGERQAAGSPSTTSGKRGGGDRSHRPLTGSPGEGIPRNQINNPMQKQITALQACATYCTCLQGPSLRSKAESSRRRAMASAV